MLQSCTLHYWISWLLAPPCVVILKICSRIWCDFLHKHYSECERHRQFVSRFFRLFSAFLIEEHVADDVVVGFAIALYNCFYFNNQLNDRRTVLVRHKSFRHCSVRSSISNVRIISVPVVKLYSVCACAWAPLSQCTEFEHLCSFIMSRKQKGIFCLLNVWSVRVIWAVTLCLMYRILQAELKLLMYRIETNLGVGSDK